MEGAGRLFLDGGHRAALLGGSKAALLGEGRAPLLGGAQKKHLVKRCFCDPVGIRTQDPQLRRLLLYPAELPDPIYSAAKLIKKIIFCNSFSHSRIMLFLTAGLLSDCETECRYQPTVLPGRTSPCGPITISLPSASSALRIIPSETIPRSLRGSKLAMKHTSLPTRSSGL